MANIEFGKSEKDSRQLPPVAPDAPAAGGRQSAAKGEEAPRGDGGDLAAPPAGVDDGLRSPGTSGVTPGIGGGMSAEELNDANKIAVTIADYKTPLVILFGPPSCGKTMTLIRLTRYLQSRGYSVQPVTSFRPAYDRNYSDMCSNFDSMINSEDAARTTSKINFMLVQVIYQGKTICQILEGPGEYYFKPEDPAAKFPKYVNAIISSQNRKIWAIIVEPDKTNKRMDVEARRNYVAKIRSLKTRIKPTDKVIFVYNKIDETPFVLGPGNIKYGEAMQNTEYLYPHIFVPFTNQNPITRLWKPYNFDFVAFQTGDYSEAADGTLTFQEGDDIYPRKLWNIILKRVRG